MEVIAFTLISAMLFVSGAFALIALWPFYLFGFNLIESEACAEDERSIIDHLLEGSLTFILAGLVEFGFLVGVFFAHGLAEGSWTEVYIWASAYVFSGVIVWASICFEPEIEKMMLLMKSS